MNSPKKNQKNSPKKGNKLKLKKTDLQNTTQTITSMFKKQAEYAQHRDSVNTKSQETFKVDNDDVQIVKVESKYFGSNEFEDTDKKNTPMKRASTRLRLKKYTSTKIDDEIAMDVPSVSSTAGEVKEETVDMISSQKENTGETEELVSPSGRLKRNLSLKRRKAEEKEFAISRKKFRPSCTDSDTELELNDTSTSQVSENDSTIIEQEYERDKDKNAKQSTNTELILREESDLRLQVSTKEPVAGPSSSSTPYVEENINSRYSGRNVLSSKKFSSKIKKKDIGSKRLSKVDSKRSRLDDEVSISFHSEDSGDSVTPCSDKPSMTKESSDISLLDMDDVHDESETQDYRVPYYLENFHTVMKTVLQDEDNKNLFNEEDRTFISTFENLTENSQKLYIRLFSRKLAWLPVTKIKYSEIGEDLQPVVTELQDGGLISCETELNDLETTLNIMSAGDLKSLAKSYHIAGTSQNKKDMIQLLIRKSQQTTIGSMFKVAGLGGTDMMLKRAKKLLGKCVHLLEEPRSVFIRMLMLFSLNDTVLDEDNGSGSSNQLFQMLKVNIGKVTFPPYTVNKKTPVFRDRTGFLQFAEASSLESDILSKIEKKDYAGAFDVYTKVKAMFREKVKDPDIASFDESLPEFLCSFTFCGVCVRILNQGVELLQRKKDYTGAVELLEDLLAQKVYCLYYRGHWWERLAINCDAHLKQPVKAMKVIKQAMADRYVRTGHRLALYQRAEKICSSPKSAVKDLMRDIEHEEVLEAPKQVIEGLVLSDNIPGMRFRFIMEASGSEGDVTFCGVEQLVLDHYLMNGYTDGQHAEGGTLSNLFTVFFWNSIFCDIPDVFHSPYQPYPLDISSDHFYASRKESIDNRIQEIRNSSQEDLFEIVTEVWEKYHGAVCGMHWDAFNSVEHFQGLVACLGGKAIAGIMERYAKMPRQTRGGFPDLILWNTDNKTFKISEVKGPGDRLSHKQILWLDYLLKLGLDAEVCYVKAVGSKRLKHI